ncbi:hypothetical protein JTB14_000491 [Gonioctena quinquepunctata]|nr:hypothetical protein JTB14_000491 [Gonioctena quinquepunctata]
MPAHIIFYSRFQFLLLNDYVKNLETSGNSLVRHDKKYQEFVYHKLRQCVKHHIKIKRIAESSLPAMQKTPMLLIWTTGVLEIVTSLYFIVTPGKDMLHSNNSENRETVIFVIYADLEFVSSQYQDYVSYNIFPTIFESDHDDSLSFYKSFRGRGCEQMFVQELEEIG